MKNVKYLVLLAYIGGAIILWPRRILLPVPSMMGEFTRDTILLGIVFAGAACLYSALRRPWWIAKRVQETFERAGLCNAKNEIPVLRSVRADRDKPHGIILEIWNKGISIIDFDKKVDRLEVGLNGKIYQMDYARRTRITHLYLLPTKYIRPVIISPKDDALGPICVGQLINLLVVGATGTGKTVAIKTVLNKLAKFVPDSDIWILDVKNQDFRAFVNLPHYYSYSDCAQGLEDYYAAFQAAQASGVAGKPQYLICDEWGIFVSRIGKKAERYKEMLADILASGRSYRFIPIIGIQRSDASYFVGGARDNFSARLALGNLSREGRHMVFPDNEEQITRCCKREGHLYIDGMELEKVKMADIADLDALDASTCASINR